MHQVIVLPHDQQIHGVTGIDASVLPAVARTEGAVGQVIKKQAEGDTD